MSIIQSPILNQYKNGSNALKKLLRKKMIYKFIISILIFHASVVLCQLMKVNLEDAKILLENSFNYRNILNDMSGATNTIDLQFAFSEDRYGADNLYQFNSIESLKKKNPDVVWKFDEDDPVCVPNSAVIYKQRLFCRLWTTKYREYNPVPGESLIQPVEIAAFDLSGCSTDPNQCVNTNMSRPQIVHPVLLKRKRLFDRLPIDGSNVNFLDKYDLKIHGSGKLERPNMNVRFHFDEDGMWLLVPFQKSPTTNPYLQRLQIDPDTLVTGRDGNIHGEVDTSSSIMMNYGLGIMIHAEFYSIDRSNNGTVWFRFRPTSKSFSENRGPFTYSKDKNFTLFRSIKSSEYISFIQYNHIKHQIIVTLSRISMEHDELTFTHLIIPIENYPQINISS